MTEKPIIFSTESIKSILAGHKTQTRRVVRFEFGGSTDMVFVINREAIAGVPRASPYQKDQVLWVKESFKYWYTDELGDCILCRDGVTHKPKFGYSHEELNKAFTFTSFGDEAMKNPDSVKWMSPLFMPKWASRIQIKVKGVQCERLQDISVADAVAEGFPCPLGSKSTFPCPSDKIHRNCKNCHYPQDIFIITWNEINGKKYPWRFNPWVWRIEFEVLTPHPENAAISP